MKIVNRFLIALTFLVYQVAYTQNWTGNLNSDWNNAANWTSWPLNAQDITINPALYTGNAAAPVITVNSVFSPGAVLIENGAVLTINANLSTQDDVEVIGSGSQLVVNAGLFQVNVSDGGRLIIDLGATMLINGGNTQVGERFIAGEDALVTINNGSASSGERLIMDLGGRFIQHNGTVSTAATFAMADGSANFNSGYELNGGTLSITGEMGFENESGLFEPTFIQNGGTMTVNGDVFWFGETPGSGTPRWIIHNGTASVSGLIQNMPLSTVNLFLQVDGTGELTMSGSTIELLHPQDSIVLDDNAQLHFASNTTVQNPGVLEANGGLVHISGATNFAGSGNYQLHDLQIDASALLNYQTPNPLKIGGNVVKNGEFLMNGHPMTWNGGDEQLISGLGTLIVNDLTVENVSPLGVNTQLMIALNGHLQLDQGIVHTSTAHPFTVMDNATASSGNLGSFVSGPLYKSGDDAFVFPIGKNGKWRRVSISAPQTPVTFSAEYTNAPYTYVSPVNGPLSAVSSLEYWQLQPVSGTADVQVGLYWEDAASSAISECSEVSVAWANGSAWENIVSLASGTCSGTGTGMVQSTATVSEFGAFTFGFFTGVTTQQVSICQGESYMVGTNTYTQAGTYFDVLQDQNMNDSIVLTTLTVIAPEVAVIGQNGMLQSLATIADEWQWLDCTTGSSTIFGENAVDFAPSQSGNYAVRVVQEGCVDTSSCIAFTIVDTTICFGSVYTVGGNAYTDQGSYTHQLTVDSVVLSHLAVFEVNTNVSVSGLTLSAVDNQAEGYQWINCTSNSIILGANQPDYTTAENGVFAVIIEDFGCTDTSACQVIDWAGMPEFEVSEWNLFPNPTNGSFSIRGMEFSELIGLEVVNALGEEVASFEGLHTSYQLPDTIGRGIYIVRLNVRDGQHFLTRIIVN